MGVGEIRYCQGGNLWYTFDVAGKAWATTDPEGFSKRMLSTSAPGAATLRM